MSAFVVSPEHISALLRRRIFLGSHARVSWDEMPNGRRRELDLMTATRTGAMLLTANIRSVEDRYPDEAAHLPARQNVKHWDNHLPTEATEYRYNHQRTPQPSAVEALRLLESYEYQASEPRDWEQTEAFRFCRALRAVLIRQLDGYEAARWTI